MMVMSSYYIIKKVKSSASSGFSLLSALNPATWFPFRLFLKSKTIAGRGCLNVSSRRKNKTVVSARFFPDFVAESMIPAPTMTDINEYLSCIGKTRFQFYPLWENCLNEVFSEMATVSIIEKIARSPHFDMENDDSFCFDFDGNAVTVKDDDIIASYRHIVNRYKIENGNFEGMPAFVAAVMENADEVVERANWLKARSPL